MTPSTRSTPVTSAQNQTLTTNLFGFITDIIYKNNNDQSKGTNNTKLICIIIDYYKY